MTNAEEEVNRATKRAYTFRKQEATALYTQKSTCSFILKHDHYCTVTSEVFILNQIPMLMRKKRLELQSFTNLNQVERVRETLTLLSQCAVEICFVGHPGS